MHVNALASASCQIRPGPEANAGSSRTPKYNELPPICFVVIVAVAGTVSLLTHESREEFN